MAGRRTPATAVLDAAGLGYRLHPYRAPGREAYGAEAAEALGLRPERVFKTLVARTEADEPVLGLVPVSASLDLKALAAAHGAKRATMACPTVARRLTGYVVGGISPLGTRRVLPVLVDRSACDHATVFCSAGRRGLQMELAPADLVVAADAVVAAISVPA